MQYDMQTYIRNQKFRKVTVKNVSIGIIPDLDLLGTSAVHKSTKGAAGIPGMPNENYIRKR